MFSMMGCVVWAARLDLDDTLMGAAPEAVSAPVAPTSLEAWLDEVSVALLLLLPLGLTRLTPLGLLPPRPPGPLPLLFSTMPLGLSLLLLETSSEVGDAPAPDDETGSGIVDWDEGIGFSEVEVVGEAEEGTAADADNDSVSEDEDDGAMSEAEEEAEDDVEGSGSGSDDDGAGEAEGDVEDDEDESPERQLESLDLSTATPCLYLNSPVESVTWKIRVSEPAGTLTFQVVESPCRPLSVSRVVEPT